MKKNTFLLLICLSLFACASLYALNRDARHLRHLGLDGPTKLSEIKGVIYIDSPTIGSLLQLRGIVGKGAFITKREQTVSDEECLLTPIRLAAGDFEGSSVGVYSSKAIRLVIYSSEVANKLLSGKEIVSKNYDITTLIEHRAGDIKIASGLQPSYGFVLNPVEWSWSSLFGLSKKTIACGTTFG